MEPVVAHSRDMIRQGSKSFSAASRLFAPATRERAYMLYAWCRYCDDQIDSQHLGMSTGDEQSRQQRRECLAELRSATLRAISGGTPDGPVFEALQRVVRDCEIPQRYPLELLAGFEMDVGGHVYADLPDTLLYAYRVAGVVGVMMSYVMGVREPGVLERAADLGIAFQLTNIARDVLDDAAAGRCYLPATWLTAERLTLANLPAPEQRPALFRVVTRLLTEADRYYASASLGLRELPFRSAWAVAMALGVYREIGEVVRRRGASAWDRRAVVSTPRKLVHVAGGAWQALRAGYWERGAPQPPRPADLWQLAGPTAEG